MEFMLTDKKGELFVAGQVGVWQGQVTPALDAHEILHNVRTHEMSGFKILDKEQKDEG